MATTPVAGPHTDGTARTVRTGGFFLPGDLQESSSGPWQLGPAWVQWEAPADGTSARPLVFVHGGGGQSTDWLGLPGAPGWAPLAVAAGFPAYLMDRPGHGRSPYDSARLGARTGFPDYAGAAAVFVPPGGGPQADPARHSAWPWDRKPGGVELDALVASSSGMLLDTALGQELDARRLVDLLRLTGPATLITHSAGAAGGWLAASRVPDLVTSVVAVEPIGPPFRDLGARGVLADGATAIPLAAGGLAGLPVLVVTGAASGRAAADRETAAYLQDQAAEVQHLLLESAGIPGNGHGLIFEANARDALAPVLRWLQDRQR